MLWAIYAHQLTDQAAAYLAKNARLVDVWAMPGLHLETYKQIVVVANLAPRTMRGEVSQGMLLAATDAVIGKVIFVTPSESVGVGSKVS